MFLLCAADAASAVNPGCSLGRDDRVTCAQPGALCLTNASGEVRCAPVNGGIEADQNGRLQCGPGNCTRDSNGAVFCSRTPLGGSTVDRSGNAVCTDGCVAGSQQACVTPFH